MARLCNVKKFLEGKNPERIQRSNSSKSIYYYFNSCIIRVSDHLDHKLNFSNTYMSIIQSNDSKFILTLNGKSLVKSYKELKELVSAYIVFANISAFQLSDYKNIKTYKEEYFKLLEKVKESSKNDTVKLELLEDCLKSKDSQIQKLINLSKLLDKEKSELADTFKRKSELLENQVLLINNLTNKNKGANNSLANLEKLNKDYIEKNKRLTAKNSELSAQNKELQEKVEDLENRLKFVSSKVSDLISGL